MATLASWFDYKTQKRKYNIDMSLLHQGGKKRRTTEDSVAAGDNGSGVSAVGLEQVITLLHVACHPPL